MDEIKGHGHPRKEWRKEWDREKAEIEYRLMKMREEYDNRIFFAACSDIANSCLYRRLVWEYKNEFVEGGE